MKYCIAENTGNGFYTHTDRELAWLSGHAGNIWAIGDANYAWIQRVNGTEQTLEQAQAIINQLTIQAQTDWDNNNVNGETPEQKINRLGFRPVVDNLPTDADDAAFVSPVAN
jgi:hypothetical protein